MQRVGAHPHAAASMAAAIGQRAPAVRLAGVFTHLAVADDRRLGLRRVHRSAVGQVRQGARAVASRAVRPRRQLGGGARSSRCPPVVRPVPASPCTGSRPDTASITCAPICVPAMELRARVSFVKQVRAGSRISYGLRHRFDRDTTVATIPIGYADGVPRRLSAVGGEVLDRWSSPADRRRGDDGPVDGRLWRRRRERGRRRHPDRRPGGPDGRTVEIRAVDWADALDTIGYEIVCGVSKRIPRVPRRSIDD